MHYFFLKRFFVIQKNIKMVCLGFQTAAKYLQRVVE